MGCNEENGYANLSNKSISADRCAPDPKAEAPYSNLSGCDAFCKTPEDTTGYVLKTTNDRIPTDFRIPKDPSRTEEHGYDGIFICDTANGYAGTATVKLFQAVDGGNNMGCEKAGNPYVLSGCSSIITTTTTSTTTTSTTTSTTSSSGP